MTTKWVVTTASERVALDEATRGGEATFTVTNQSPKSAQAMFDIKTGDGVDESWFSIEGPNRPIRPAASVPYLVKIQVPQQVPPGQYEFEARVYPPDSAPEENFVLSRRVLLEVPSKPEPPKKKFPWWIVAAAALLVLVIGVVTWLVWPSGGETPQAAPSASPTPSASAAPVEMVTAPNVVRKDIEAARKELSDAGLELGDVTYLHSSNALNVYYQSLPAGLQAPKGTKVDLLAYMSFGRPTINSPGDGTTHAAGQWPRISWTQAEQYVSKWQVTLEAQQCTRSSANAAENCANVVIGKYLFTGKEYTGPAAKLNYNLVNLARHSGWVSVTVAPVDDLGNVVTGLGHTIKFFMEPPK